METVLERLNVFRKSSRIDEASAFMQHGDTKCLLHMIAVAYYSEKVAEFLNLKKIHRKELIVGALLHDYFLYDWHDGKKERRIHGFTHPSTALKNASQDFVLNARERDIIKKHMFPLTLVPPKYAESWIVCMVDKACSVYETFMRNTYPVINNEIENEYYDLYEELRR